MGKPVQFDGFSFMLNVTGQLDVAYWLQWLDNSGTRNGAQVQGQEVKSSVRLLYTAQNYTFSCKK